MKFFVFKNKKKSQPQHPDFIVKDEKFQEIGIAYKNKKKNGEPFWLVKIKDE